MTNYIPKNSSVLSHINALMSFNLCEWSVVWEEVVVQLYNLQHISGNITGLPG